MTTRYTPDRIAKVIAALQDGTLHPRDAKMELAREIVSIFHGEVGAARAEEHFRTVFQHRELPVDMESFTVAGRMTITDVIAAAKMASSKSEARRLIAGDGVTLDGRKVSDPYEVVTPLPGGSVLQVGKRRFARLIAVT